MAEVVTTVFGRDIQRNIYPDNAFYKGARKDAGVDVNATTIEIPQAGVKPTVVKNPSVFPLTIEKITGDKKSYTLDLLATLPTHIEDLEAALVSYDKRAEILMDHQLYLEENIAAAIALAWAPPASSAATNIIRTTGADKTATAPGATGNRKKITLADFIKAFTAFNNWNIPQAGRRVVMTGNMFADLLQIPEFQSWDKMGRVVLPTGSLGQILGFDIYVRSILPSYSTALAPKAIGATGATTDNELALFFHPSYVRYAEGNVKVYMEVDKPQYLGSLMNAAVRTGGVVPRADLKGVLALVEA